jgi:hypothetical protein
MTGEAGLRGHFTLYALDVRFVFQYLGMKVKSEKLKVREKD